MGKVDIESKKYMRDKKHFADAFNYLLYEGKPIIDPEEAMADEYAGLEFSIDRIKLPGGGGTAFEVPSGV